MFDFNKKIQGSGAALGMHMALPWVQSRGCMLVQAGSWALRVFFSGSGGLVFSYALEKGM